MLRHEVISTILAIEVDSFRQWLESCCNADDLMVAVWAAMGHHLKIGLDEYGRTVDYCIAEIPDGTGDGLEIYTRHSDFKKMLEMGRKFGLNLPDEIPELPEEYWSRSKLENALARLHNRFAKFAESKREDWEFQKYAAAVKATVMAADLAGSAIPNLGENIKQWIQQELGVLLDENDLQKLLYKRLNGSKLLEF